MKPSTLFRIFLALFFFLNAIVGGRVRADDFYDDVYDDLNQKSHDTTQQQQAGSQQYTGGNPHVRKSHQDPYRDPYQNLHGTPVPTSENVYRNSHQQSSSYYEAHRKPLRNTHQYIHHKQSSHRDAYGRPIAGGHHYAQSYRQGFNQGYHHGYGLGYRHSYLLSYAQRTGKPYQINYDKHGYIEGFHIENYHDCDLNKTDGDQRPLDPDVYEAFDNLTQGILRNNSLRGTVEFILQSVNQSINNESVENYYDNLFPGRIPGPQTFNDRIAVVGGGPSGIHMAYLLKEKGFTNITVFEKSSRVGGKSKSIRYRGALHEMGTVYWAGGYENVHDLFERFTNSVQVPANQTYLWNGTSDESMAVLREQYYVQLIIQDRPELSPDEAVLVFVEQILRYIIEYFDIFGVSKGQLPPQPNDMNMVRGSFLEYLRRNNLLDTRHYFVGSLTLQGYGQLDEIPALYGLIWNTPQLVLATILAVGATKRTYGKYSNGYQDLWEQIVRNQSLNIRYNTEVMHVDLGIQNLQAQNATPIRVYQSLNGRVKVEEFDFVVWAIPAVKSLCSFSQGDISRERELFTGMTNSFYTSSLIDEVGSRRSPAPEDWFYTTILSNRTNAVWASRDSYGFLNSISGPAYQQGLNATGDDGNTAERTLVVYQYSQSDQEPRSEDLKAEIDIHFNALGATSYRIVDQNKWAYFSRFSNDQIESGNVWRVLDLQGLNRVWYIGGSTSFDSVKGCVDYNLLLINRMIMQG